MSKLKLYNKQNSYYIMASELCIRKKIEYELPEDLWQIVKDFMGIFDCKKLYNKKIHFEKIGKIITKNMLVTFFPDDCTFILSSNLINKNLKLKIVDGSIKFIYKDETISSNKLAIKKIKKQIATKNKLTPNAWKELAICTKCYDFI